VAALIGALRVSLSADTAKFQDGMRRAERQTKASASAINKSMGLLKAGIAGFVGALSVGMLSNVIKNSLEYAGSLAEVAQQLGVTTRDLQNFRAVGGQVGISTEEMDKGLLKLRVTLGQVAAGAKAPTKALAAIGISARDVANKDTGDALRLIADGLAKVGDSSQRAAVEVALFGRTGAKLDPLLAGGSKAINELAAANEALGGVLSDEQIQNADKTADKLAQLHLVLKTQIAGVVANNSDAILGLARAFVDLVGSIGQALNAYRQFRAEFNARIFEAAGFEADAARARGSAFVSGKSATVPGRSVTVKLAPAPVASVIGNTGSINQFLAGGGGGKKRGTKDRSAEEAERKRLEALRDAFQFDQDQRRAQQDILRAQRDLATNFDDRNSISVQILDAERAAYVAELEYEVAAKEKTKTQADALLALYDTKDALERQKIVEEEAAQAAEESARYQALAMDLDRDLLESRADLAETASERRKVELELLDFAYRQRKAALDAAIAQEKDAAALQRLTLERDRLMETYANNKQGVLNNTRGPGEDYLASLPTTTAKWNEALEQVKVNGLQGLEDGLIAIMDGTKSVAEAFHDMAQQIIADLIRIAIQKYIIATIGNAIMPGMGSVGAAAVPGAARGGTFALPAFAAGGAMILGGRSGRDRNLLMMNGVPIARVSRGEMMNITPANEVGSTVGGNTFNVTIQGNASRESIGQMESALRRAVASSSRRGY
jgi:hypothetical protein